MTFSSILKAVEAAYGLNDHALHHKLSVSEETIRAWKEGLSYPDEETLSLLSEMFALPLKTLKDSLPSENDNETKKIADDTGL